MHLGLNLMPHIGQITLYVSYLPAIQRRARMHNNKLKVFSRYCLKRTSIHVKRLMTFSEYSPAQQYNVYNIIVYYYYFGCFIQLLVNVGLESEDDFRVASNIRRYLIFKWIRIDAVRALLSLSATFAVGSSRPL